MQKCLDVLSTELSCHAVSCRTWSSLLSRFLFFPSVFRAEHKTQSCPLQWMPYMSSCYQLSTERESWWHAEEDCVAKGAHLVILNHDGEEVLMIFKCIVYIFLNPGCFSTTSAFNFTTIPSKQEFIHTLGSSAVWIGLRAKQEGRLKKWTWVDGSPLTDG